MVMLARTAGNIGKRTIAAWAGCALLAGGMLLGFASEAVAEGLTDAAETADKLKIEKNVEISAAYGHKAFAYAESSNVAPSADSGYLNAVGFPEAWRMLERDVEGTIAIVDTGADLDHPELVPYLTEGINLLNKRKPPEDDNGHGTAVAGIVARIAAAGKGGTANWNMKIMPVKALDETGAGTDADLVRGVRYAVDHGANIVVLSLGLHRDVPEMREAAAYAEAKGVLLVAASGNDALEFGDKAAVSYPAVYPTVLGVAGTDGRSRDSASTSGPEVDLAAMWSVETLEPGGGTTEMEGTSMGAPQVAAAAAMLRAAHPDWTPVRLRETLRRTAEDIGAKGWDRDTGYGLVRADKALAAAANEDWREPNDSKGTAYAFPVGKEVAANWSSGTDSDWYALDVAYDGRLRIEVSDENPKATGSLALYASNSTAAIAAEVSGASSMQWKVKKGRYYLQAKHPEGTQAAPRAYRLVSGFQMAEDAMEPNDSALAAYTLAPRSQQWTGTFHVKGDEDWTVVELPKSGTLKLKVSPDTTRIDPSITLQKAGEKAKETDINGSGESEELIVPNAAAGKYYIKIRNAVNARPEAVIGTYTVDLEYIIPNEDPNEPNDTALTATPVSLNPSETRNGLFGSGDDADWYKFTVSSRTLVRLQLDNLPEGASVRMRLSDKQLEQVGGWNRSGGSSSLSGSRVVEPGTYYVTLTADGVYGETFYKLKFEGEPAYTSFTDATGHWAERAIAAVTEAGWMAGYGNGRFRPDRNLTRAEAAVIAVRAFQPNEAKAGSGYEDVTAGNWAYGAIARAETAGWLYWADGSRFEPDALMTRAEAVALFARAAGLNEPASPEKRFSDLPADHFAAAAAAALVEKGWLSGFGDGTFRPDRPISRAEWAALLARLA